MRCTFFDCFTQPVEPKYHLYVWTIENRLLLRSDFKSKKAALKAFKDMQELYENHHGFGRVAMHHCNTTLKYHSRIDSIQFLRLPSVCNAYKAALNDQGIDTGSSMASGTIVQKVIKLPSHLKRDREEWRNNYSVTSPLSRSASKLSISSSVTSITRNNSNETPLQTLTKSQSAPPIATEVRAFKKPPRLDEKSHIRELLLKQSLSSVRSHLNRARPSPICIEKPIKSYNSNDFSFPDLRATKSVPILSSNVFNKK